MMNISHTVGSVLFRIVIPALLLGIQVFLYWKSARWVRDRHHGKRGMLPLLRTVFLLFNAAAIVAAFTRPHLSDFPQWFLYAVVYPYIVWHAATFFIGLVLGVTALIKLPFKILWHGVRLVPVARQRMDHFQAAPAYRRFDASRRVFLRRTMYGVTAFSFGGTAYGMLLGKVNHDTTEARFPIQNLPPALSGFTIALISDIHSSAYMGKDEMDEYVRLVNDLACDLVVVGGDFVNGFVDEVYPFAEAFSNLRAPVGVYGVMGNHDFYTENPELVAREVVRCGIGLLRNDKTVVERNGGQFYLIGVDDPARSSSSSIRLDEAIGTAPLAIPKILLSHRPYYLNKAADRGIDLVLSGHTHGGQIVIGRVGDMVIAPASLASPYVWGRYSLRGTQMYVSRGIGTVGLPIRINCPPEITKITLVPAAT